MYVLMYALVKLLHSHFVRMALAKWLKNSSSNSKFKLEVQNLGQCHPR